MSLLRPSLRSVPALVAGTLLFVAGCSSDAASQPEDASEEVTVRDESGEVTVPVTDSGIYAMDEYAAVQLLSIGVQVDAAASYFGDPVHGAVLEDAGIELLQLPSLEEVLSRDPSLIVGISHPDHVEQRADFEELVPVVLTDYNSPWSEQLEVLAEVTGRDSEAEEVIAAVEARTADVTADIASAGLAGRTVSLVAGYPDGAFFAFGPTTPSGRLVEAVGLTRPAGQQGGDDYGFIEFSGEQLPAQRGDVFIAYVGTNIETSAADLPLAPVDGAVVGEVDNLAWGSNTPLATWWMLRDLAAILLEEDEVAAADDALTVWQELTAAAAD